MKSAFKTSLFKTGALLLPFAFAACTSDDSSSWLERPESFGEVVHERHLARGTSAVFDCKVYSRDNHITLEMSFDAKMYESTMNTVFDFEVGDPTAFYVDVLLSGMFQQEADVICDDVKDMDENMETSCSSSHVKGKVETDGVIGDARASIVLSTMKSNMETQCDEYYDYYKDVMSEMPGKWIYNENAPADPAQSCDVYLEGDTLYMNVVFASRSLSMNTYLVTLGGVAQGFRISETYTGLDSDTFEKACSIYRKDSHIGNVYCTNPTITYMMPTTQNGEVVTLEDLAVAAKTELCAEFLDGNYTLEDMWNNN